jgi:hypothetical protein
VDVPPALRALVSAGCKAAQNTLGAGGAWCVRHVDVVAFVLRVLCFLSVREKRETEMKCVHVTRINR